MYTPFFPPTVLKPPSWLRGCTVQCVLSLLFLAWLLPAPVLAAANQAAIKKNIASKLTPEQQYAHLKQQLVQLQEEKGNAKTSEQWQALAQSFYQLHINHRREALGANALFMSAQVLRTKGQRLQKSEDIRLARQRYLEFVDLYPGSSLADDSLFEAAALPESDTQSATAETLYAQLLAQYPQGDQAVKARKKLDEAKALQQTAPTTADKLAPAALATAPSQAIPPSKQQVSASSLTNLATVAPVKFWSTSQYSRIVLATSAPIPYSAKKSNDNPTQLLIELQQSSLDGKNTSPRIIEQGLLKSIEPSLAESGVVRFRIDLHPFSEYKVFTLQDPFRVVVDIYGGGATEKKAESTTPPPPQPSEMTAGPTTTPVNNTGVDLPVLIDQKKLPVLPKTTPRAKGKQEQLSLAQQLGLGVRTIVIDPGHGGKDPGAMAFGLKEKDIVLIVAQKLAKILKQTYQYQVVLTRTKDVFIPLEKRTAMANSHKADLFISIHVNAHADQSSSGIETYFLNLATDADAMRVAALENASSNHSIGELQDILSSLMNNSKIDESSRLARFVQSNLISGLKSTYKARDLGVKQAPFYVLIGAEMPAILAELSFITNPAEAKLLQDEAHLEKLANQLAGGIVAYIEHHHAAARTRLQ